MLDITLTLQGHAEGSLLVHSLRSAEEACRRAVTAGLTVELAIVLHDPSPDTLRVAKTVAFMPHRIHVVDLPDLADCRNYSAAQAKSRFLAFLDGDDLVSPDWLVMAYDYYRDIDNEDVILHTEVMVGFQDEFWIRHQIESAQPDFSPVELSQTWFFCNNTFAPIEIYRRFAFPRTRRDIGLGGEDWAFAATTIAAGIRHEYVPGTAYYYRRRAGQSSYGTLPGVHVLRTPLFDPASTDSWNVSAYMRVLGLDEAQPAGGRLPAADTVRDLYRRAIDPESPLDVSRLPSVWTNEEIKPYSIPEWLDRDWRWEKSVDRRVFPDNYRLRSLSMFWPQTATRDGFLLALVLGMIGARPAAMILTPFFRYGGAERMVVNYLNAFRRVTPPDQPVVLLRLRSEPASYLDLDPGVTVIELGRLWERFGLDPRSHSRLIERLLIELRPYVFWTINNHQGISAIERLGKAGAIQCLRVVSAFSPGWSPDGYAGFAVTSIPSACDHIDLIVSDNLAMLNVFRREFAIPEDNLVFCPAAFDNSAAVRIVPGGSKRVLWFSRLDVDKRIDLLIEIARRGAARGFSFVVYGVSVVGGDKENIEALRRLPNVDYRGALSGLGDLARESFDAYLYTSAMDGFPFVLLEMAALGLPIVASKVGGIGEVIRDDTGYPVAEAEDPDAYLAALDELLSDRSRAAAKAEALVDWLRRERRAEMFDATIAGIYRLGAERAALNDDRPTTQASKPKVRRRSKPASAEAIFAG